MIIGFWLSLLLACPAPVLKPDDSGADDTSGADDSGADDSADTNDTKDGPECDGSELTFSAHGFDGGDNEITGTFVAGTIVKGLGRVTNPCDVELSFTTNDSCLVKVWRSESRVISSTTPFGGTVHSVIASSQL